MSSENPPNMDGPTWDGILAGFPDAHLLQTWEWAQVKSGFGWEPLPTVWHDKDGLPAAAAMVLARKLSIGGLSAGLRVMYVPKGPVLQDWGDEKLRRQVLADLRALALRRGAIFIKIDPDVCVGTGEPGDGANVDSLVLEDPLGAQVVTSLRQDGWRFSTEQIQFRNTVVVDLTPSEDELLASMKQKTRYNVRLAARRGVEVRPGGAADKDLLYQMYAETSVRDDFVIRDEAYYRSVWDTFIAAQLAEPLIAEVDGEPVAALVIFRFAGKAWYLHGMSRPQHREKMPNYLLQWEAMRRAKAAGCDSYDLWGAPDTFSESDPMWGVYRFKDGFGGQVVRHMGAWDLPVRPIYYRLYTQILPRVLSWLRNRGLAHTRQLVSD